MSFAVIGAKPPADDSEMNDSKNLLALLEASYLSSPEKCERIAARVDSLMQEALNKRDAALFGELIKAFKAEAKLHRPLLHQAERLALSSAWRKLQREGNSRPPFHRSTKRLG